MVETDVLTPDTVTPEPEALQPQVEDTAEGTEEADTETETEDTRDFDAELEAARKTAKEEALKELQTEEILKAHRQNQQRSMAWLATEAAKEIRKNMNFAAREAEKNGADAVMSQVDMDNLARGIGMQMASHVATREVNATDQLQDQLLADSYPEWRIPTDLVRRKEAALANGDSVEFHKVRLEIAKRAVLENEVPKEAQKLTVAEQEKAKKAGDVARLQKGSASTGPSKIGGTSPAAKMTLEQIDQMPTAQWMSKPKEERERLLRVARGG